MTQEAQEDELINKELEESFRLTQKILDLLESEKASLMPAIHALVQSLSFNLVIMATGDEEMAKNLGSKAVYPINADNKVINVYKGENDIFIGDALKTAEKEIPTLLSAYNNTVLASLLSPEDLTNFKNFEVDNASETV